MNFKTGDKVNVIAGKDKGKSGKILHVLRNKDRVVVEGVNIVKKHQKPTAQNQTGGIIEKENVVKLTMSTEAVEVSAKSNQVGSATETINVCQYNSERLEISFNASYVADAIKACGSEDVVIQFLGEMKPFVVKNVNDESQIQLIAPMRTYN